MTLLKKYPKAVAFLASLCLAFVSPYLVPADPDSFVMRGSVLFPLLLLLSLPQAGCLADAKPKGLVRAFCLSLLFAFALSLGSELAFYGAFLPGTGSLLRRLLVPVLAAPCFTLYLVNLSRLSLPKSDTGATKYTFPLFFFALLLLWLPVLLAYWPGMLNYDFPGEYTQHLESSYSLLHPLFHSVLMNGIITLGEHLHSRTFGLLLMTLFQMGIFASVLASGLTTLRSHHVPRFVCLLLLLFFGLHPIFSVMAVSMTKDTLFTACVLGLILSSISFLQNPEAFLKRKRSLCLFFLYATGTALIRANGPFVLIPLLIALFLRAKNRSIALRLCAASALLPLSVHLLLVLLLHPTAMPSFQLYSLPAQQLVRAYQADRLSEEDQKLLESLYTSPEGLILHPHLADPAKGYLDREKLEKDSRPFLTLWLRNAKKAPKEYLEAFLLLNIGSWYPDDTSHSTIYPDVSYNEKGYLQTQEYDMSDAGFTTRSYLPKLRAYLEQICRYNRYQKYPLIPLLFAPAVPFWCLLLALYLRRSRQIPLSFAPAAGLISLFVSYLLGPCTLARYMLPFFVTSPFLLVLAFTVW